MKREDDQELWDLLGKLPEPILSPFFSRNVTRKVREESSWGGLIAGWFSPRKLVPAAAMAVAVAFAAISLQRPGGNLEIPDDPPETISAVDPEDYEVIADLEDLLAFEDDALWTENDS